MSRLAAFLLYFAIAVSLASRAARPLRARKWSTMSPSDMDGGVVVLAFFSARFWLGFQLLCDEMVPDQPVKACAAVQSRGAHEEDRHTKINTILEGKIGRFASRPDEGRNVILHCHLLSFIGIPYKTERVEAV